MSEGQIYDPMSAVRERHALFEQQIARTLPEDDAEFLIWLAERLPFRKTKASQVEARLKVIAGRLSE